MKRLAFTSLCCLALILAAALIHAQYVSCTYTMGYWKTHKKDWPVTTLTLGLETFDQNVLLVILRSPTHGDATLILAHQLIAAKLNIANGAYDSSIVEVIAYADGLLRDYPVGSDPQDTSRMEGIELANELDQYNNGLVGPEHCSNEIVTPTPLPEPTPTPTPIDVPC